MKQQESNPISTSSPLVSIITVVLNDREGLKRTIQSVQNIPYPNIEYIVIDGGSTDGTVDVIKENSHCISSWISEPDKGISDAFNKGIAAATGTIIGLINAGDCYRPEAVELVVKEYQNVSDKETFFCSGHMYVEEWNTILHADPGYALKLPFMMPLINHPTCFVAASIYKKVGVFNTDIYIAMDYEFLLRCHRAGIRIICLDHIMVDIKGFGISDRRFWQSYKELLKYSEKKLLTLMIGPYMLLSRMRLRIYEKFHKK